MGFFSTILYNIKNMKKAKKIREMGKENLLALEDEDFYEAMICLCDDAVYDIKAAGLTKEQILAYSLYMFEMEVNNGGLCQFFVNSSSDCAPFISEALEAIGATELRNLFEQFVNDNDIDVTDLSSFKITDIKEYEAQTKRFDFDSFDEMVTSYQNNLDSVTTAFLDIENRELLIDYINTIKEALPEKTKKRPKPL